MSNLVKHAIKEFDILKWQEEESQKLLCDNVIELLKTFTKQNHSGSSADYVLKLFSKLARFESISPLTGEGSEWIEVDPGLFQNNRDPEVFKAAGEKAYWIGGKIFIDEDGFAYTNKDSSVEIEFPWSKPEPEYIRTGK